MKTTDLITRLAENLGSVRRISSVPVRTLRWIAVAVLIAGCYLFFVRGSAGFLWPLPTWKLLETGLLIAMLILSTTTAAMLGVPGLPVVFWVRVLALCGLLWFALQGFFLIHAHESIDAGLLGGWHCGRDILAVAMMGTICFFWASRRSASLFGGASALSASMGFSLAVVVPLQVLCKSPSVMHFVFFHMLPPAVLGVLLVVPGEAMLSLRGHPPAGKKMP